VFFDHNPKKPIRIAPLDPVIGRHVAGEIDRAEGHAGIGIARDGHRRHMHVTGVVRQQLSQQGSGGLEDYVPHLTYFIARANGVE